MNEFKLVNGVFSTDEAKKIIMSLINSKIDFHNLNAFSDGIRNNSGINTSKSRIEALTQTRENIIKLIAEAEKNGMKLNIKSDIIIELI
ncbi:hypothetical protein [Flavobacterium sp.]|uniref:hypothetical protein n=1 Tax=Flavobacterium sp. TaxID=239 RepID=UPI0025F89B60|nr:hypothetical protein [Flavobacterium sp.]